MSHKMSQKTEGRVGKVRHRKYLKKKKWDLDIFWRKFFVFQIFVFFNFNCFSFSFVLLLSGQHLNRDRLRNIFGKKKLKKKLLLEKKIKKKKF